jgi:hypothetical protein
MTLGPILLMFAAAVVAYDAAASALVLATGWSYNTLATGALLIQAVAGSVAGRRAGFLWAMIAGASTALAEATLGFGASWLVGPGRSHLPNTVDYLVAVGLATLAGGALGGVGGALSLGWSVGPDVGADGARARWSVRAALRSLRLDGFVVRALLGRGILLWLGLRVMWALVMGAGSAVTQGGGGAPLGQGLVTPDVRIVELLVALAFLDLARRREFLLFADLGLGPVRAVTLYVLPGALLEAALLLVPR